MDRKHLYPSTAQAVDMDLLAEGVSQGAEWPTAINTADSSIWYQ